MSVRTCERQKCTEKLLHQPCFFLAEWLRGAHCMRNEPVLHRYPLNSSSPKSQLSHNVLFRLKHAPETALPENIDSDCGRATTDCDQEQKIHLKLN
uniref:Uncharacterized protein n=1 Tax=Pristionchus pacificus TaxID=54126 RepID=A0A2A6CXK0_PRIPA|eukprot:PDM82830.1 hypothetical protein PRIPAC_37223 [Pristionchus pacificus]